MRVAVIGGGAAGFAAAIAAAERGARVTVLERNAKPLKKLGVTGNGRGNILNAGEPVYYGDPAFARAVLGRMNYQKLEQFFRELGVPLRAEDEGRMYPASLQASAVQDALLLRAGQLKIDVRCSALVERVEPQQGQFTVYGLQRGPEEAKTPTEEPFSLTADRVIVACGGAAAPAHGTDGSAYHLLTRLGHQCTPVRPALCALNVPKKRILGLQGQRARAALCLTDGRGNAVHGSRGEVLFAQDAVSGIAAMQLARFAQEGMELRLDLCDELNVGEDVLSFVRFLAARRAQLPVAHLFAGALAKPVSRFILREAGVQDIQIPIGMVGEAQLRRVADTLRGVRLPVTGTRGFEYAQVTAGGLETDGFSPETLESRWIPGLYAAGEMLNVDGECGGFNLMFAFAGGRLAGEAAGA